MAIEKRMDHKRFEKMVKELTSRAEVLRSRQDQKQVILNDFEKERKRYQTGKISKKALSASVPRVRKELMRLDKQVKISILSIKNKADEIKRMADNQSPKGFKVSISGVTMKKKKK
jgi:hypothetical protein